MNSLSAGKTVTTTNRKFVNVRIETTNDRMQSDITIINKMGING